MNPVIRAVEPEACPTLTQVQAVGSICRMQCGLAATTMRDEPMSCK